MPEPRTPVDPGTIAHRLRRISGLLGGSAIFLLPWTVDLAVSLPHRYLTPHWNIVWSGFDALLLTVLAAAAIETIRRRRPAVPLMVAAATLLTCDAWFDVTTGWGTPDLSAALLNAAGVELPLAVYLLARARAAMLTALRITVAPQPPPQEPPSASGAGAVAAEGDSADDAATAEMKATAGRARSGLAAHVGAQVRGRMLI